jgi:hypothetical protein
MPDTVRPIPLAEIDAAALTRDRTGLDPEPRAELQLSLATSGLRQPIEVFPLAEPSGPHRYGLLSGYRRLLAFRSLHAETGQDRWAAVPAWRKKLFLLLIVFRTQQREHEEKDLHSTLERADETRVVNFR